MRKYHRWLALVFGAFLLWISATGLLSQIVPIVQRGGFEEERGDRPAPGNILIPAAQAHEHEEVAVKPFACPADMVCRPKPKPGEARSIVGTLHHLHSGESFGPLGVIISILSGLSLFFFAFSGLWMYIQMYRRRAHRKSHPRSIFW